MAERLAPVDEYGMPYAVHPYDAPNQRLQTWSDEDHVFYQNMAPELANQAGRALRYSRVQEVARWLHDRKHHTFRDGLEQLPQNPQDMFGLTILSCAGYLSRDALDLRKKGKFELVRMSDSVYQFVQGKRQLHFETHNNGRIIPTETNGKRTQDYAALHISRYFGNYAGQQNLDHLKNTSLVDEFLNSYDVQKRHLLARIILDEATQVAVEPINPIYHQALQEGLIRSHLTDPATVVRRLQFSRSWEGHLDMLQQKLAA